MISMAPKSTPQDETGLFGLLAFLADSRKCAERAEELRTLAADAGSKFAAANSEVESARRMLEEAVAAQGKADEALKAASASQATLVTRTAAVDKRERELAAAQQTFIQFKDKITKEQAATAEVLAQRESAVVALEQAAAEAQSKADAKAAEYTQKIGQLRQIAG